MSRARDKNKNDDKNLRRKLVDYSPKQGDHKQRTLKHRNKVDRNAPITSKDVFPKRSAKMIDGTQKPKIPLNFAERAARYKEFGYYWDFFWYSKLIFLFFVLYHFMLPGNFYCGSEIRHGIFWGINFGPVIFLGFDFCPHSIIPVT